MIKTPVAKHPEFTIYYENYEGSTFYHCDVYKWDKDVRNKYLDVHNKLVKAHNNPLYALVDNKKLAKFAFLIGFKPYQEVSCTDGLTRHVWIISGED